MTTAQTSRDIDPATQPQRVPGAIDSLGKATERLHERLVVLTQRLDVILAPLPPAPVADAAGKLARHSLALQIESETAKVNAASDRVDALISRLEI